MSAIQFVNGLIAKEPRQGAPNFVKASLSIKREDFVEWLNDQEGDWINADIKVSRSGKWYVAVNDWKPESTGDSQRRELRGTNPPRDALGRDQTPDFDDLDDMPF